MLTQNLILKWEGYVYYSNGEVVPSSTAVEPLAEKRRFFIAKLQKVFHPPEIF